MTKPLLSRKSFLTGCAAGVSALLVGCSSDGDDDTGGSTGGSSGGPTTTDGTTASTTNGTTAGTTASTTASTTNGDSSSSDSGVTEGSSEGGSSGGSSGGGSESGSASMCTDAMIVAEISNNHGHSLEVPLADIEAGIEVTYDCSGSAGHCHQVTLTSEDFAALRAGMPVIKYSCNGGDHQYVLSCVSGAPAAQDPGADCDPDPMFGACP